MERKMRRGNFLLRHGTAALLMPAFFLPFMAVDAANAGKRPVFCTKEYAPVCALVQVMCVRAPCPAPVRRTFGNACEASVAGAKILHKGRCRPRRAACRKWKEIRICGYGKGDGRVSCTEPRRICLQRF